MFLFYWSFITCFVSIHALDDLQLVFVNALWRHGARSSLHEFPNDPNKNYPWPNGQGQLTQVGMKQHYELGRHFRKNYGGILLDDLYLRKQIYVRSTDVDRTLMSAQSNMAGLYPPHGYEMWNGSQTSWQPFPVHTVPRDEDYLLALHGTTEEGYKKILNRILSSDAFIALQDKNKEFLNQIKNWSGWEGEMNLYNSWSIQDPLACERAQNLTLPEWATEPVLKKLSHFAGLDMGIRFGGINYENRVELAPYTAGPLVGKILQNMKDKVENKTTYNFVGYSAHDTTVSALLVTLQAYNWLSPPFASTVIFELYKNKGNPLSVDSYFVRAYYKNSSSDPVPLNLVGCDLLCPLPELIRLTNDITQTSSQNKAKDKTVYGFVQNHYLGVILVLVLGMLFITWFSLIVYVCRSEKPSKSSRRSAPKSDYIPLSNDDDGNA